MTIKCVLCWDKKEIDYLDQGRRIMIPCPECRPMDHYEDYIKRYHDMLDKKEVTSGIQDPNDPA